MHLGEATFQSHCAWLHTSPAAEGGGRWGGQECPLFFVTGRGRGETPGCSISRGHQPSPGVESPAVCAWCLHHLSVSVPFFVTVVLKVWPRDPWGWASWSQSYFYKNTKMLFILFTLNLSTAVQRSFSEFLHDSLMSSVLWWWNVFIFWCFQKFLSFSF